MNLQPSYRSRVLIRALCIFVLVDLSVMAGSLLAPAGRLENSSLWFEDGKTTLAVPSLGKDLGVGGWIFFGSDRLSNNFGDTSHRTESLPAYVKEIAVAPGAKTARFDGYIKIPLAGGKGDHIGTLTLSDSDGVVELISVRMGSKPPEDLRLVVLVDNLGTPEYVSRGLSLAINGVDGSVAEISPNGQPDWIFWDLPGLKDGSEITIRISSEKKVAAIGGLVFLSKEAAQPRSGETSGSLPVIDHKIGEFSREGEYMKDYYVFREGETFHLFYNVGNAGKVQQWFEPGNEKAFGHATSKDLKNWDHHPRLLDAVPGTWEGMVVSAPSIIKYDGTYYMFYTGFDDRVPGKQTVGLATSKDLFDWKRHPGNPVYEAPEWAERRPDGWIDCRDSHVIRCGDEFLLFTMVTTKEGKGAIALASSKNLTEWKDLGPAVVTFKEPESPRVFEHAGSLYMFISSAHGKQLLRTTNPKTGPWEEIPFRWPAPGLWSGWEVVEQGERTIFSAFEWKSFGNLIRFWEVEWKDGVPTVVY